MEFANKTALVTGGASGIGAAISARLAEAGARVVIADLRPPVRPGPGCRYLQADVATEAGVAAMLDDVARHEGPVDIMISNAGIGRRMDLDAPMADWTAMMAVNLWSHIWAAQRLVPDMARRGGVFLVTASAAGLLNEVNSAGYGTAKHGALGFAEWLAIRYRETPAQIQCLCPEGVDTPLIEAADYLKPRMITPGTVADRVMAALETGRFLISTHDSTLTGLAVKAEDYEKYLDFMAGVSRDQWG